VPKERGRDMGNVLIVNESTATRSGDRRVLGRSGFRVLEATNIYEASVILYQADIDLVLLDTATEEALFFIDLLSRLHPQLPVILTGASAGSEVIGAGGYHDRREGSEELLLQIARAMERRRVDAGTGT
jgi:DNA-binding NtrC family response regulator